MSENVQQGNFPKNFEHFIPYFIGLNFLLGQLFHKLLSGMLNSVDPDQTAPSGAV